MKYFASKKLKFDFFSISNFTSPGAWTPPSLLMAEVVNLRAARLRARTEGTREGIFKGINKIRSIPKTRTRWSQKTKWIFSRNDKFKINIILTGGDSKALAKHFENHIFVNNNLVLQGLNKILNYNVQLAERLFHL